MAGREDTYVFCVLGDRVVRYLNVPNCRLTSTRVRIRDTERTSREAGSSEASSCEMDFRSRKPCTKPCASSSPFVVFETLKEYSAISTGYLEGLVQPFIKKRHSSNNKRNGRKKKNKSSNLHERRRLLFGKP